MKIKINKRFIYPLVLSFLTALITGGLFPIYIFCALISFLIIMYINALIIKNTLSVNIKFDREICFSWQQKEFTFTLDSPLPVPFVLIKGDSSLLGLSKKFAGSITVYEKIWQKNKIRFNRRGIYRPGNYIICAKDIFSLFEINSKIESDIRLKVFPPVLPVKKIRSGGRDIFIETMDKNSTIENPYEVRDIRKYNHGDNIKSIHWKITAKQNDLMVRNNEHRTGEGFSFLVDMNKKNFIYDDDGETEEMLIVGLLSVLKSLMRNSISYNVFLNMKHDRHFVIETEYDLQNLSEKFLKYESNGTTDFEEYIIKKLPKVNKINKTGILMIELTKKIVMRLIDFKSKGYDFTVFCCIKNSQCSKYIKILKSHNISTYIFPDLLGIDQWRNNNE